MVSSFPVPIQFSLPSSEWHPVDPAAAGVPEAFAVGMRHGSSGDGYVPVLTVRGIQGPSLPSLEGAADLALNALRLNGDSVDLVKRTRIESEHMPSVVQLAEIDAIFEGRRYDLYQAQVIERLSDSLGGSACVMLFFTVTCKYGQFGVVGPEFESFIESVVLGSMASN